MAFFAAFLATFSSLLTAESLFARLLGGGVCLLFGFWARFYVGRPSPWLAPLFLVSCFLRLFPLWGFFTETLGNPRGVILFFLAWLAVFLLAAGKKEAPPFHFIERTAIPFALFAMAGCLLAFLGIPMEGLSFSERELPAVFSYSFSGICSLSGMLLLPRAKSLLLTYGGVLTGILLALLPVELGQGLFLAVLSPLFAAAELRMVCSAGAYTVRKRKKPRKD